MTNRTARTGLRIDLEDAATRYRESDVVVLDVVQPEERASAGKQVAGAVRIPPDRIEQDLPLLPEDRSILAYCT